MGQRWRKRANAVNPGEAQKGHVLVIVSFFYNFNMVCPRRQAMSQNNRLPTILARYLNLLSVKNITVNNHLEPLVVVSHNYAHRNRGAVKVYRD